MKKLLTFSLIVLILFIAGCSNTKKADDDTWIKIQVIIKNISDDYIYVAEIKSGEVTYGMYNIERDDLLKKENFKIGDILEIEYKIKEDCAPPIIKLKSFKILP